MDVSTDYLGNASCKEVPDDDAAVVAANSKQGTPAVKRTGEGHADAIQSAISLLITNIHKRKKTNYKCNH